MSPAGPPAGAFRCLLQDLNSLGHRTRSPESSRGLVCTWKQSGNAQLTPAWSLGSSPEVSGGSSDLCFGIQNSLGCNTTSPGWARGQRGTLRLAGRSQCDLVSPAGPSGSLQVSASGSGQPGPQHPVSRSAVHQRPPGKRQLALVSPVLTRPTNTSEN